MTTPESGGRVEPLPADALYRTCDIEKLDFETTDDLDVLEAVPGQDRASESVRFGIGIRRPGFNIYALGPEETDRRGLVRELLEERAKEKEPPGDLCYVNNFDAPHQPRALELPGGTGRGLADDIDEFLEQLPGALTAAFQSEEYQSRRQSVQEEAGAVQQEALEELQEKARERGLGLIRTPMGFAFAPLEDGEVMSPDEIEEMPDEDRERLESEAEELQQQLTQILRQVPQQRREAQSRLQELDQEVARQIVEDQLGRLRAKYEDFPKVRAHLDAIQHDIVHNARQLLQGGSGDSEGHSPAQALAAVTGGRTDAVDAQLRRYRVNVLVDHTESENAPIVYEDHPTYMNLVGRVEYLSLMGALVTDFNMIKPGALHRANGGYLVLDARRVLLQPFAWEGLKRALQSAKVRIESPREALGLASTVTLDPEPMDVDLKVVLVGSRLLYYLLALYDPDFADLFKVQADFEDEIGRDEGSEKLYARFIARLVREAELRPFDRSAVGRAIERAARKVSDAEKLSVQTRYIADLLRAADYWAEQDGAGVVSARHVQKAIDHWIYRSSRLKDRVQEEILREVIYIDTDGSKAGQVNGLSVVQLGEYAFGRPNRITARVRLGKGEVVNIEREVELSGPIHSKGVLILSGFLGGRYAGDRPLSLSASLVFEQSYGGVEGDSASLAELCALLSAIGDVPIRQSIALTGSVNQHGEVQPIGGVNEKIEGFFDICASRGLNGEQGVVIPASNVKHLMLREDVVDAVRDDRFGIWPVRTVDQTMELLTGLAMGERDEEGNYPEESVNYRVEQRLAELAEKRMEAAGRLEEADST